MIHKIFMSYLYLTEISDQSITIHHNINNSQIKYTQNGTQNIYELSILNKNI